MKILNLDYKLIFNNTEYEMYDGGANIVIISKDRLNQFVVNYIVYDICKFLNKTKNIDEIWNYISNQYKVTGEEKEQIFKAVIELALNDILQIV